MRLTDEEDAILTNYCNRNNANRSDAVREAIQRLNDRGRDYFLTAEWREKMSKFETIFLIPCETLLITTVTHS